MNLATTSMKACLHLIRIDSFLFLQARLKTEKHLSSLPVCCPFVCASYDTIRYDSVYLTCSKKLTGSQLSL